MEPIKLPVRNYEKQDKNKCIEVFKSNWPRYFDKDELPLFTNWLDHQGDSGLLYQSPGYSNSEKDVYYVIDHPEAGLIACGGFYILKDRLEARLAWGMVHSSHHNKGYGTLLYEHRKVILKNNWPKHTITLGTSQHTNAFYEKMGMKVIKRQKDGFGPGLDQVDMTE